MPRGAIKGALCHIFLTGAGGRWARCRRFQPQALGWGVLKLAQEVGTSPPQVILAVGNRGIRHTNTAAARVFRAFNRVVRAWKEGQETHPNATWFSG